MAREFAERFVASIFGLLKLERMSETEHANEYPDWEAANEPMRVALARWHHLGRTTGVSVPEAKEQFFAALQDAFFLIRNVSEAEDEGDELAQEIAFFFQSGEGGVILPVFSSVSAARRFYGPDEKLNRLIHGAPGFFGTILTMAHRLEAQGENFLGVLLDGADENSYFFTIGDLVSLASGGKVLDEPHNVRVKNEQIEVLHWPPDERPSPELLAAFRRCFDEHGTALKVVAVWGFWMSIAQHEPHLGLALETQNKAAVHFFGPKLNDIWSEVGPRFSAFDLMILGEKLEGPLRERGAILWQATGRKRGILRFLRR